MNIRTRVTSSVFAALMLGAPAFAQSAINNNQPVQGDLHAREATLQARLTASFDAGLLDSTELSSMQRDLDGILTRESDFKTRSSGLTSGGFADIEKALSQFEGQLDRHSRKSNNIKATDTGVVGVPVSETTVPVAPVTVLGTGQMIAPGGVLVPSSRVSETTVGPADVTTVEQTTIQTNDMVR